MKLIVTALWAEAAPIAEQLQLQRISNTPFSLYADNSYILVCSEPGVINASAAVAFALSRYENITSALNIGICAAPPDKATIGTCFSIGKLIDRAMNRVYHLTGNSALLPKATLACVAQPISEKEMRTEKSLVDMESTGFYSTAKRFLPQEKIKLCKIVSDYGTEQIPDPAFVHDLIRRNLPLLEKVLASD